MLIDWLERRVREHIEQVAERYECLFNQSTTWYVHPLIGFFILLISRNRDMLSVDLVQMRTIFSSAWELVIFSP